MGNEAVRSPVLNELYQQYLVDQDTAAFVHRTAGRYSTATLARLAEVGDRMVRRAAVLALGYLADYESNCGAGPNAHRLRPRRADARGKCDSGRLEPLRLTTRASGSNSLVS